MCISNTQNTISDNPRKTTCVDSTTKNLTQDTSEEGPYVGVLSTKGKSDILPTLSKGDARILLANSLTIFGKKFSHFNSISICLRV